jgi:hypothetical protein
VLLTAGAVVGIGVAVGGVARPRREAPAVPDDAVALVGDARILRDDYASALAAAASARPEPRDGAELRRGVVDRLVDEELLVEGAIELGLPSRDANLRKRVAAAMSESVLGSGPAPPDDETLRAVEASHATSYRRGGRVRIEAFYFTGRGATDRAVGARGRLLEGVEGVAALADPPPVQVPLDPVPVASLTAVLGASTVRQVDALTPGEVSMTLEVVGGAWIVRLLDRTDGELAPLDEVRSSVLDLWKEDEDNRRLRRWLEERRRSTRVVVREVLP